MTDYVVSFGAVSSAVTLYNGDVMMVLSGGTADQTIVDSGGTEIVSAGGVASAATINYGGTEIVFFGTVSQTIVNSGGIEILSGGASVNASINGTATVDAGGMASVSIINGGAIESVESGGSFVSGAVNGYLVLYRGGTATSAAINVGGNLRVYADATTYNASLNGTESVYSGGAASNTVVNSGGYLLVSSGASDQFSQIFGGTEVVSRGGNAYQDQVYSTGIEVISSGGSAVGDTVYQGGLITVTSGGSTQATVLDGGVETLFGKANDTFLNSNGTMVVSGVASNSYINSGGTLDVYNLAVNNNENGGSLVVQALGSVAFTWLAYNSGGTASIDGNDLLTVNEGTNSATLQLAGDYQGEGVILSAYSGGGTEVTIACYGRGTMITTDAGERPIEELAPGDLVATLSGQLRPIRWIGRRAYDGRFITGNRDVLPILFKRGSLGEGLPRRDLMLSPLHAIYFEGALIPAWVLRNDTSIVQLNAVESIEYFHLELDRHDVIIAEGVAAESYVEDGDRGMFQNADHYQSLHPASPRRPAQYYAPRQDRGPVVEKLLRHIERRAMFDRPAMPSSPPNPRVTSILVRAGTSSIMLADPAGGTVQGVVLDGRRLGVSEALWRAGSATLQIEPSAQDRWCHIEIAAAPLRA